MEKDYEKCLDKKLYQEKACKWSLNDKSLKTPHNSIRNTIQKIYPNVLEFIGNTPMIRLNNIPKKEDIQCELLAKCEFYNPGGSTKDRIGYRMIQELEKQGKLKEGSTLIEATSGNTGIGVALTGASKGYNVIITLPEKMSQEKSDTLKGLGAKIVRTPTEAPFDSVESHIGVALKLNKEIKDSVIPDQYVNVGNALAHYDGTAEEIWEQCDGKIDYVVISAGTGGTLTGIGRKLKEKDPKIQIIGVDPEGSLLALPDELNEKNKNQPYKVEGIGYDFIPKNCDQQIADKWIKTEDKSSFYWARRLIREEGLLVGGSAGTVLSATMTFCKTLPKDKRVVMVLVDGIRNYMSKFLNDDWMIENGFYEQEEIDKDLKAFGDDEPIKTQISKFTLLDSVLDTSTSSEVLEKMESLKIKCLPVLNNTDKKLIGIITKRNLTAHLLNYTLKKDQVIKKAISKEYKQLNSKQPMRFLSKAFIRHEFVIIKHDDLLYLAQSDDVLSLFK